MLIFILVILLITALYNIFFLQVIDY